MDRKDFDHHAQASGDRMRTALFLLYDDCEPDPATLIGYALCDLRHLCDMLGLDFAALNDAGYRHYLEEKEPP